MRFYLKATVGEYGSLEEGKSGITTWAGYIYFNLNAPTTLVNNQLLQSSERTPQLVRSPQVFYSFRYSCAPEHQHPCRPLRRYSQLTQPLGYTPATSAKCTIVFLSKGHSRAIISLLLYYVWLLISFWVFLHTLLVHRGGRLPS